MVMMMLLRRALARVARPNASRRGLRSSANTGSSASSSSPPSTGAAGAAAGANGATKTAAAGETASSAGSVTTLHSATPGIMRIRKGGGGANGKVVEVDSTIARIIGSDWGDRRNQTVSLPMRIYWLVFGVVLVNGAYTYFAGKDEAYLVEKLQKKVDEKLGVVETNEFVVMADQQKPKRAPAKKPASANEVNEEFVVPPTSTNAVAADTPARAAPASVFSSSAAPTTMPFFSPSSAAAAASSSRPKSKADLQAQLQQLRGKQLALKQELQAGESFRAVDDIEFDIRLIDQQKAQVKRMIKRL